jgi:hypothetical protein
MNDSWLSALLVHAKNVVEEVAAIRIVIAIKNEAEASAAIRGYYAY